MIDTAAYKTKLENELEELTAELKNIGIHNPEVPKDWIATPEGVEVSEADPNVVADRNEEWAERRASVELLETRYNNLVRALKKIEEGGYGVCEITGGAIEADRLDANPAARTCKAHIENEAELPT